MYELTDLMISADMAVKLFSGKDGDFITVETETSQVAWKKGRKT